MLFDLNRTSRSVIVGEANAIAKLAFPMMVAQIAQVATGFVDMVMSGQVGTDDLAAVSLGSSVLLMTYITLMGVVSALNPIIAHQLGAGEQEAIGSSGRQGLWCGLLLGLFGMALMLLLRPLLHEWLTLPEPVKDKVSLFITGAAFGMPGALMHRALHAYSSSLHKTKPIMVVSLLGLALNIPLNYVLIHGLFGLPALGGPGCGWATGIVFWFNFLLLLGYIVSQRHFKPYALTRHFEWPKLVRQQELLHLGWPIGMSFFLEVSLFSLIAFLIAKFGTVVVAGHQAVHNVSSLVYMIPQSMGIALSVRVGQALGRQDPQHARIVCGAGLILSLGCALATMAIVLLGRHLIISFYSSDPQVLALGATLLLFSAFYQLVDAAQTIASGALRGYKLTAVPMLIHAVSFWGVGLGLGAVLGLSSWPIPFLTLPMGVYGFWIALVISLTAAALLLVSYLAKASRERVQQHHPH